MKKVSIYFAELFIVAIIGVFLSSSTLMANSFFWQGTDVFQDSGPIGLLDYSKQKEIHDTLLRSMPILLYPDGPYADGTVPYDSALDGLPNPNGRVDMNGGLTRMPDGFLEGERGLRIACEPGKCWEGYTLLNAFFGPGFTSGVVLIDMDGQIVHQWPGAGGSFFGAAKMLPGGDVVSAEGFFGGGALVQRNWCGQAVKEFDGLSNHHDHQREGSTVGYYYPGMSAFTNRGKTLSLGAEVPPVEETLNIVNVKRFDPQRPDRPLTDDVIREIPWNWDGTNALFEWHARDHFDNLGPGDLGLGLAEDEAAQYALDLGLNSGGGGNSWGRGSEDWTHANSVAWLGNNRWYAQYQDERFNPDNIIADFRSLNVTVIIARHDHPKGDWVAGDIVWRLGPHYGTDGSDGKVGQVVGQHMAYMIPDTLPGGGNIMLFDNGGGAGYGALIVGLTDDNGTPEDFTDDVKLGAWMNKYRNFSRVIEINPITKQIVWQYVQARPTGGSLVGNDHKFYSNIMSGAQRLLNGNTLITEADTGRVFEVTRAGEVVWEYAPDWISGGGFGGSVYRAYRVPEFWLPTGRKAMCE